MHSLRPCLTVFAIVFALCVGAKQSAEGYDQEHLERLKTTLKCPKCDLTGADLRGAKLWAADLTGAYMFDAIFCNTRMPSGKIKNSGCKK